MYKLIAPIFFCIGVICFVAKAEAQITNSNVVLGWNISATAGAPGYVSGTVVTNSNGVLTNNAFFASNNSPTYSNSIADSGPLPGISDTAMTIYGFGSKSTTSTKGFVTYQNGITVSTSTNVNSITGSNTAIPAAPNTNNLIQAINQNSVITFSITTAVGCSLTLTNANGFIDIGGSINAVTNWGLVWSTNTDLTTITANSNSNIIGIASTANGVTTALAPLLAASLSNSPLTLNGGSTYFFGLAYWGANSSGTANTISGTNLVSDFNLLGYEVSTQPSSLLQWAGGAGVWNGENWINSSGNQQAWVDNKSALITNNGTFSIAIASNVIAGSVTLGNSSGTITFLGESINANSLVITNTGSLLLGNSYDTFTSASIYNGSLLLGVSNTLTLSSLLIDSNGTLNLQSNNLTVSNTVTVATGSILGSGTLSANNFMVLGSSTICAQINGSATNSVMTINSGGSLTVNNSGDLSVPTVQIGSLTNSSNNSVLITGSNSSLTTSLLLYVGSYGSSNSMTIANGAAVSVMGTNLGQSTYIGLQTSSSNNSLAVTGSNSILYSARAIFVGKRGSSNSFMISNGGSVSTPSGIVGDSNNATNNFVLVTDTGSRWVNSTNGVDIGHEGSSNSMVISNGGAVSGSYGTIGWGTNASNNSVVVTGSGSSWSGNTTYGVVVGNYGSSNSMVISNGGAVSGSYGTIGWDTNASNNSVVVTGSGSSWINQTGAVIIGYSGSSNSMVISNGGGVQDVDACIGYSGAVETSNNMVIVTGVGSYWSNSGFLRVGWTSSNSLVVSNGGTVSAAAMESGGDTSSSNNSVIVTGAGSSIQVLGDYTVGGYYGGSEGRVTISNQATLSDANGYVGITANSSNNSALITGAGSTWSNSNALNIGNAGSGTLTVGNGGQVTALGGVTIASQYGSTGTLNVGALGGNDTAGVLVSPFIYLGSGSATINFNQADTAHITSPISGNGFINQLGSGSSVLSASNTFTGPAIVNAGSLVISSTGSLSGGGSVMVNAGAIIQNNGMIAGATTVGGTLSGNGGSFSSLKLNSGSSLIWDVGSFIGTAGTAWDVLNAQSLDLRSVSSSNPITINIEGISGVGNGSSSYAFNFMNVAGSVSGFSPSDFSINSSSFNADPSLAGGVWSISSSVVGGVTQLQAVYAVPEPSTYALFGVGLVSLLAVRRKRLC